MQTWYQFTSEGLILALHIQPGAKRSELAGIHGERLKIRLKAPAIEGRANQALLELLAELCTVSKAEVSLLSGHESRQKRVLIRHLKTFPEALQLLVNEK